MDNLPRCEALKLDGSPCQANALPGSRYCTFHAPELASARSAGRKLGGARRSIKAVTLPITTPDIDLASAADLARFLGQTLNQVRRGELDCKLGNSIAVLSNALLRALQGSELEQRIAELEQRLGTRRVG